MFNSYSSYGEDAILNGLFNRIEWINEAPLESLTYIDLGCFDPILHSNTFFLYLLGWRGTLVDANPTLKQSIDSSRPEDLFINNIVSTDNSDHAFFMFSNGASSNTASKEFADKISISQNVPILNELSIKSITLDEIVNAHISKFRQDPFLIDIDIEGWDLNIIKSYSWKVRIPVVMIEDNIGDLFYSTEIRAELENQGYIPIASSILTTIYIDSKSEHFSKIKNIGPK